MNKIPESIKTDNWRLYEQAMSPDPAIAAQYAVKLTTTLWITMKIAGIHDYDLTLVKAINTARLALSQYTETYEGHEGESLQTVSEVIMLVGPIIYDPDERFANRDNNAFTGR